MGNYVLFCARLVYNKYFMYLCRAITEDNLHVRTDRLCTHADAATKEEARRFVEQKLGEIEISVDNLRAQIARETYRLLPLSYIAEHYFGKSVAWLSQRLNGTLVRGRSYTLNEEQKKIFNDATQDISLRIGSIHLV